MGILDDITQRIPVEKGWSGDQKYHVITSHGEHYLLRISPAHCFERRQREFCHMQTVAELEIPMCRPVEFGTCTEGVYVLHTWIHGTDAETVIPGLSQKEQYAYGQNSGRILKIIHSIPAPDTVPSWVQRFSAKIDRKLQMYADCPLKYENGEAFVRFVRDNRHLLTDRPQSYQHGDYHIGNMMIDREGILTVIDFDREDYGDPWEEFNRIVWCAQQAPAFAAGMVDGYFDAKPPIDFWRLLALYICSNTLGSLPWAISFGEREIAVMREQAEDVLGWYDNMTNPVPNWYRKGGN